MCFASSIRATVVAVRASAYFVNWRNIPITLIEPGPRTSPPLTALPSGWNIRSLAQGNLR
jgi:hypothetical protein